MYWILRTFSQAPNWAKNINRLLLLALIGFTQMGGCVDPVEMEKVEIATGNPVPNPRFASYEVWKTTASCSTTNSTLVAAVVIPGTATLDDETIETAVGGLEPLDPNVSAAHKTLLRDQLLASGTFNPIKDTIYYYQSSSPLSFQTGDSIGLRVRYANGYPVKGNIVVGGTTLNDLNSGLPLTDYIEIKDSISLNSERYFNRVFSSITVHQNIPYGINVSVLTGMPQPETLVMDVYEPAGDVVQERPLVIFMHGGFFLKAPLNGRTTGTFRDSAVVEVSKQLAQRGYVVASLEYRLGWNPVGTQEEMAGTYLNALYRGVQDARTAIRFFRKDANLSGNTYGIDTARIAVGGMGEGGSIAAGALFLDKHSELELPQFLDSNTGSSFVDTSISGNMWGTNARLLNMVNHAGYSSRASTGFLMGGAVLDSSWIDSGEPPVIAVHTTKDPYILSDYGPLVLHQGGGVVVHYMSGGQNITRTSKAQGNQQIFEEIARLDRYSDIAAAKHDSLWGLYLFQRPQIEYAPWEWWDSTLWMMPHPAGGTFHSFNLLENRDMSKEKALNYIDTTLYFVCRRLPCLLDLPQCRTLSNLPMSRVPSEIAPPSLQIYPVPARDLLQVHASAKVTGITLLDLKGVELRRWTFNRQTTMQIDLNGTPGGIYFLMIELESGQVVQRKVVVYH